MVFLRILRGSLAGKELQTSSFPLTLGRNSGCGFVLDSPGIWDKHASLDILPTGEIRLKSLGDARVFINDQPVQECILKTGDLFHLGGCVIQFGLSKATPLDLKRREMAVWASLLLFIFAQLALVFLFAN